MDEKEFIKIASEYGYDKDEIQDFIELHKETGIPYDLIVLEERIKD